MHLPPGNPVNDDQVVVSQFRKWRTAADEALATLLGRHDYPPLGRATAWQTTVAEQRERNIHVHDGVSEDAFVALRTQRAVTIPLLKTMLESE